MRKIQKPNSQGFTIIEVLIVLAIAGLIIAIVLFAVPVLQRNGRNTAIKSDANQLVAYASDFSANNDGAMPTAAATTVDNGAVTIGGAANTSPTEGSIQKGTQVTDQAYSAGAITPAVGTITLVIGGKCPGSVSGPSVAPVQSGRSVAAIYAIETSGSALAAKCVGS